MHLFTFALLASILSVPAFAQDSCGFLHKQTQAFSDAGQRGDGAAMGKMLDPDVIFFNETGEKATRIDMAGATPPAAGTPYHLDDRLGLQSARRCGGDELHRRIGARAAKRDEIPLRRDLEEGRRCLEDDRQRNSDATAGSGSYSAC